LPLETFLRCGQTSRVGLRREHLLTAKRGPRSSLPHRAPPCHCPSPFGVKTRSFAFATSLGQRRGLSFAPQHRTKLLSGFNTGMQRQLGVRCRHDVRRGIRAVMNESAKWRSGQPIITGHLERVFEFRRAAGMADWEAGVRITPQCDRGSPRDAPECRGVPFDDSHAFGVRFHPVGSR
jgi:hypothetical protein